MEQDIHAPTTAGDGAQRNASANDSHSLSSRDKLLELIKQKDNLEAELSTLGAVLDSVRFSVGYIHSVGQSKMKLSLLVFGNKSNHKTFDEILNVEIAWSYDANLVAHF